MSSTRDDPPPEPRMGDTLPGARPCPEMLSFLLTRRSVAANSLGAPGPSADELRILLRAAARVPDHGKLTPWRFIVVTGDARDRLGAVLERATAADDPTCGPERLKFERKRLARAPVVVVVVSRAVQDHKIPEWEQILSAGAVCHGLLLAAHAAGYAGQWLTEWYAYHDDVRHALMLDSKERIAGFVYIGTPQVAPLERARPNLDSLITQWTEETGSRSSSFAETP